jgi:hypothetical protein
MGKELHAADVHFSAKLIAPDAVLFVITLLLAVVDMVWCRGGHWSVTVRGVAPVFFVVPGMLSPLLFERYRYDERTRVVPAPVVWTRFCSSGSQLHQPFLTGFEG